MKEQLKQYLTALTLCVVLLWTTLVSGCVSTQNSADAFGVSVKPLAKEHAAALANCDVPACEQSILTGTRLLAAIRPMIGPQ
jgi:outer membrane murein-binding lipoprotein Lpp